MATLPPDLLAPATHAVCHIIINLLPFFVHCDPGDVSVECVSPLRTRIRPGRILIYEKSAAAGIMHRALCLMDKILARAYAVLTSCNCSAKREERKKKAFARSGLTDQPITSTAVSVIELPTASYEWEKGCLSCKSCLSDFNAIRLN